MPPLRHLTIITGASRGLGLALAQQCMGPEQLLLCLSRHTQDALVPQAQATGTHLEQWSQDLADPDTAGQRLEHWLDSVHPPSLGSATLINNAGMIPAIAPLSCLAGRDIAQALRVGLEAPMVLSAVFLRATERWLEHGFGGPRKVLNISSGLGRRPMASQGPYCAAKAGLDHFSRCVALEEAAKPQGARVVALAPGVIDTDMQTHLRNASAADFADRPRFEQLKNDGLLTSPHTAARQVLAYLHHPDFGQHSVTDVRTLGDCS